MARRSDGGRARVDRDGGRRADRDGGGARRSGRRLGRASIGTAVGARASIGTAVGCAAIGTGGGSRWTAVVPSDVRWRWGRRVGGEPWRVRSTAVACDGVGSGGVGFLDVTKRRII
jgi:hypothetical protein